MHSDITFAKLSHLYHHISSIFIGEQTGLSSLPWYDTFALCINAESLILRGNRMIDTHRYAAIIASRLAWEENMRCMSIVNSANIKVFLVFLLHCFSRFYTACLLEAIIIYILSMLRPIHSMLWFLTWLYFSV